MAFVAAFRGRAGLVLGVFALVLGLGGPVLAAPSDQQEAQIRQAAQAARAAAQPGPRDITPQDQGTIHIPAGESFIPAQQADDLMAALGNHREPGRVGLIVPRGELAHWLVDVSWVHDGYVRDGDAKEWQPDAMLDNIREGTEKQNEDRIAKGIPALDITGWVEKPTYDNATHRLIWSLAAKVRGAQADQPQNINYNTYALGREGYFSLDLITDSQAIAADKSVVNALLASLQYAPGKRYQDFTEGSDKVAAYGLAGLIGVVAIKKLGLLAIAGAFLLKAWKLALVLALGGWAAVKRFFGRMLGRKPAEESETEEAALPEEHHGDAAPAPDATTAEGHPVPAETPVS